MTRKVFELSNELLEFFEQRNHTFKKQFGKHGVRFEAGLLIGYLKKQGKRNEIQSGL